MLTADEPCCFCLQYDHRAVRCKKIRGVRCGAIGCREEHDKHFCSACGEDDADHTKSHCPKPVGGDFCPVKGCNETHDKAHHFCKVCQREGVDHVGVDCLVDGITSKMLYHQTDRNHAKNIVREGEFRRGTAGLAGPAIYFSEKPEDTTEKAWRRGFVVVAKVYVGVPLYVDPVGDPNLDASKVSAPAVVAQRSKNGRPDVYAIYDNRYIEIVDVFPFPRKKPRGTRNAIEQN